MALEKVENAGDLLSADEDKENRSGVGEGETGAEDNFKAPYEEEKKEVGMSVTS